MSQTQFKAEIYRDERQEFRWHVRARNGRVVADGAEGYRNRSGRPSTCRTRRFVGWGRGPRLPIFISELAPCLAALDPHAT